MPSPPRAPDVGPRALPVDPESLDLLWDEDPALDAAPSGGGVEEGRGTQRARPLSLPTAPPSEAENPRPAELADDRDLGRVSDLSLPAEPTSPAGGAAVRPAFDATRGRGGESSLRLDTLDNIDFDLIQLEFDREPAAPSSRGFFGADPKQDEIPTVPPPPASTPNVMREAAGETGLLLDDDALGEDLAESDRASFEDGALGLVSWQARRARDRQSSLMLPPASQAAPARSPRNATAEELRDRYAVGDYTGALELAEGLLNDTPGAPEAGRIARECRAILDQMYTARLTPLSQRASVAIPEDQIRWLTLDHRAGFLLALVDGQLSVEDLLDISGMSRLDALKILDSLVARRVIALQGE